jgi:hypothetical protein
MSQADSLGGCEISVSLLGWNGRGERPQSLKDDVHAAVCFPLRPQDEPIARDWFATLST